MGRLNISLNNEQIEKIQRLAKEQGKTVSSIIGESVAIYEKILETGKNLKDMENLLTLASLIQGLDAIPVPSILLDYSIGKCMEASSRETEEMWYETGKKFGELIKTIAKDIEDLKRLSNQFKNIIPIKTVEIQGDDQEVTVILVGSGYSKYSAIATSKAARGFLSAYGFSEFQDEVMPGFVKVRGRAK